MICILISLVMVVKHTTLPRVIQLGVAPDGKLRDLDEHPEADSNAGILFLKIEDAIYFANIGQVKTLVMEFVEEAQKELADLSTTSVHQHQFTIEPNRNLRLVLEFKRAVNLSALYVFVEMLEELMHRGVDLYFVSLHKDTQEGLRRSGLLHHIPETHFFERKKDCYKTLFIDT
jgi:MFS superfamily sulfate permease-like transporter